MLSDNEFRVLLDLWMSSDPWPLSEAAHSTLLSLLANEATRRGHPDMIDAFHTHTPVKV